jgi:hypothetical protein
VTEPGSAAFDALRRVAVESWDGLMHLGAHELIDTLSIG